MNPINFPEAQNFMGRPNEMTQAECSALPIARGVYLKKYPAIISCWQPTEEERAAIAGGAPVYLHVIGSVMQPVMLSTQIETETLGRN